MKTLANSNNKKHTKELFYIFKELFMNKKTAKQDLHKIHLPKYMSGDI